MDMSASREILLFITRSSAAAVVLLLSVPITTRDITSSSDTE